MKLSILLLLLACFVAASQARSTRRRARRDMTSTMQELTKKFPLTEWKAFWAKLNEALGSQKAEFEQKLAANKGNMDLTLDQFKDKMTAQYPQVKSLWDQTKTKFDSMTEKLKTITLNDVVNFLKEKMTKYAQTMNYDNVRDWMKDAQMYVLTYWNQLQAQVQG